MREIEKLGGKLCYATDNVNKFHPMLSTLTRHKNYTRMIRDKERMKTKDGIVIN